MPKETQIEGQGLPCPLSPRRSLKPASVPFLGEWGASDVACLVDEKIKAGPLGAVRKCGCRLK
jgi:hypothetical protein